MSDEKKVEGGTHIANGHQEDGIQPSISKKAVLRLNYNGGRFGTHETPATVQFLLNRKFCCCLGAEEAGFSLCNESSLDGYIMECHRVYELAAPI